MKVTVNFGSVKVIVPCGKGDFTVNQLMELAVTRYKKAAGKDTDIIVHNLKVLSDGGILDPDDKLNDVADDREQIIATFEECNLPYLPHNGGDGTSASSIGTESPDIFQHNELLISDLKKSFYNGSDVEITKENISLGILPLHVRRGSEPALNHLPPTSTANSDSNKRWSAAIMVDGGGLTNFNSEGEHSQSENELPPGEREDGSGEEKSSPIQDKRREPLGGPVTLPILSETEMTKYSNYKEKMCEIVKLKNEEGPLGIHVVPAVGVSGNEFGLVIQGIEPGGRIDRDGRFNIGDKITEINGLSLDKESFHNTQEIFKDALKAPEISICCVKNDFIYSSKMSSKQVSPPLVYPKPVLPVFKRESDSSDGLTEEEKGALISKSKFLTPTKKPSVFSKSPSSAHSSLRKVGRRILIHLKKGSNGLGFSISSKESTNSSYLFIKNILPSGAALDDGRLKVGDRILEINRVDMTGKNQSDAVNILRNIPFDESVELVVSRPEEDVSPSPHLPRELPPEKANDGVGIFPWNKREVFTFDIPLNDTGSAGLGVSVKGKMSTNPNGAVDMGIFVKTVIHGGAASKDGRLRPNDQLLNINSISLLAMTNSQAMETLRRAMIQSDGLNANPHAITLTVARRMPSPLPDGDNEQTDSSCHERSDSLLSESGDSFYVSNENLLSPSKKSSGITPDTSVSDNSGNTVICLPKSQDITMNENINFEERTCNGNVYDFSEGKPIIEQLMGFSFQENQLQKIQDDVSSYRQHNHIQQPVTLMDASPEECASFFKPAPAEDDSRCQKREEFSRHKKSFSNPAVYCQSPVFYGLRKGNASQQPYISDKEFYKENGEHSDRKYSGKSSAHVRNNSVQSSVEPFHKEMPVDVGPCETYVKHLPNKPFQGANHQSENSTYQFSNSADSIVNLGHQMCSQKRSCHSPGCPYHTVPTTEKEQGNSPHDSAPLGPSLGLCKSSSLESLQTMVHKMQKRDSTLNKDAGRGCNESFRAAVDRSYEAPNNSFNGQAQNDSEIEANLMQRSAVSKPHVRSATVGATADVIAGKKNAKSAKKKGIFKGLGSVFKFGKSNKKSVNEVSSKKKEQTDDLEREEARRIALEEQERIHEKYQKLVQQEQLRQFSEQCQENYHQKLEIPNGYVHVPLSQSANCELSEVSHLNQHSSPPNSRQERMHLLRAEHQRRHQQRQGFYPRDEQEELYEQQLKKIVDKNAIWKRPLPPLPHQAVTVPYQDLDYEVPNARTRNFEIYKEMSKPGSRKGFVDPDRYSHYMNFQEIQQHLLQFQNQQNCLKNVKISEIMLRLQHEVPSDTRITGRLPRHFRHTLNSPRSRPLSDLFEFECTENSRSPVRMRPRSGASSLPRQSFTSSRQRPPIPAYMMLPKQTLSNGHVVSGKEHGFFSSHSDESNSCWRTFDMSSSKV